MAASIKIRSRRRQGYTEIKLLLTHPMENGRNRDPISGQLIPAHFIQELVLDLNDKRIITASLGGSLSKNPFFTFRLNSATTGDRLTVRWTDNLGLEDNAEHVIE